ncbi:MAG: aldehyde dehydrogenase [Spirochaetia bacterium]
MPEIKSVFEAQKKYFHTGQASSLSARITNLKKLKSLIQENENEIMQALREDLGKSPFEVYASEIGMVYEEIAQHIKHLRKWARPESRKTNLLQYPAQAKVYKVPLGVVLIMGPFNYPFQLLLTPLVGAISGGNCAILKPSERTPATCKLIENLINTNFPAEFLYVIDAINSQHLHENLLDCHFDHIFFTGGCATGKIIMKKAAEKLIPVTLELGGKSPCIVDADAKVELAAKRIVWGKFLNAGQTCVAPDYVYVHKQVKQNFLACLVNEIEQQFGRNAMQSADYGRMIDAQTVERLAKFLHGQNVHFGGDFHVAKRYFSPTVLVDVRPEDVVMQEEIFGPILPILEFDNLEYIIKDLAPKEIPLALYYFGESKEKIQWVLDNTRSGGVTINDTLLQVISAHVPFGGQGNSGMGQYHGKASFDTFTHQRSVIKRSTAKDINARYAPYRDKIQLLRKILK